MPSSISQARRAIEALAKTGPGDEAPASRVRSATWLFLGLLASALAEREGRFEAGELGAGSLDQLQQISGYRFGAERFSRVTTSWTCATRAARSLAGEGSPAHDTLTQVYEAALKLRVEEDDASLELVPSNEWRKRHGAFYTPRPIARSLVETCLAPLDSPPEPRILDPAMGTGTFLLEALELLAPSDRAEWAERCLFGIDRDVMAVQLAVLALWLHTGARPSVLARNLRSGDALCCPIEPRSFDVVVGNPPWGARYGLQEQLRLRSRFPSSSRLAFDSFKLFLDLGSFASRGTLGMVVPRAVLAQALHGDIRSTLLQRMAPYAVQPLGDHAFRGAAAPACTLIFVQRPGPPTIRLADGETSASRWTCESFSLTSGPLLDLVHRLRADHPSLNDLAGCYRVRDAGLNYNRASLARRVLYQGEQQHDQDLPYYRGRNFGCYTTITPHGWLRHDAGTLLHREESLYMRPKIYQLPEKIVFRQTADRPLATLDRSRMVMGRSVLAITREADVSLPAMLVCLNSRLMTAVYRALVGEEGRILPQVKVAKMLMLPIPAVSASPLSQSTRAGTTDQVHIWALLAHLGARLLACQGKDHSSLRSADELVYALYGLTEEEIALVEGRTTSGVTWQVSPQQTLLRAGSAHERGPVGPRR